MKRIYIITIILLILVFALAGYIVFEKYSDMQQETQLTIFQQGAQYGYEQAVISLMEQASTCQTVPIYYENESLNLIAVECLTIPS